MNKPQTSSSTAIGAAVGFLVALVAAFCFQLPIKAAASVFDVLDKPVDVVTRLLPLVTGMSAIDAAGLWYLFHFVY